jgi:hypothetical protein
MELRDLSADERSAYFTGIQPIWGGGLDGNRFQQFQRRLADSPEASQRYRLLGWFDAGRMLSAMKAYDLEGGFGGRSLRVLGIGAVFTPTELRRRGHAAAMLRAAIDEYRGRGAHAALLFSDIDAAYYERLGFRPLESRECMVEAGQLPPPRTGEFRPAAPGDEVTMADVFARARDGEHRLSLSRDGWALRFQLRRLRELARARGTGEPEWGVVTEGGAAMVRFGRETVDLLEAAWLDDGARARLLSGLRDCMQRTGRMKLRAWPSSRLRGEFQSAARASAIAMVAPLDGTPLPARGASADLALLDHI